MALQDLAVVLVGGLVSAGLILVMRPLFLRYALARPNARSSHKAPTPQGGGVAVILGGFVAFGLVAVSGHAAEWHASALAPLAAAVVLLMIVGVADDILALPASPRLVLQAVAAITVVATLPAELRALPIAPLAVERAVEVLGLLWMVNLVNFMDGIDWITVAETVPVTAGVFILFAARRRPADAGADRAGAARRDARLCAFQPSGGEALPRRRRQPADRSRARMAAAAGRR